MAKKICLLGATGSIGLQTLDIMRLHPDKYTLLSFSAHTQVDKSFEIIKEFNPQVVVMVNERAAQALHTLVREQHLNTEILSGAEHLPLIAAMMDVDTVVAAIVGAAGLSGVLSAAQCGKTICLANKEALVMTGPLLMQLAKQHGAQIFPVDSEHNALFQCMPAGYQVGARPIGVKKLLLTASGGPFLDRNLDNFDNITPQEAVKHPNWSMGAKISIDSATMMNKGLELIEASFLFDMPANLIDVVIHPQSIIHSMVHYVDGSYLAQMGTADMRIPISSALSWPNRTSSQAEPLDFSTLGELTFKALDFDRFPAMALSYQALKSEGNAPCLLNAANEIAVQSFMDKAISFVQISQVVEFVLNQIPIYPIDSIEQVLEYDKQARDMAKSFVAKIAHA